MGEWYLVYCKARQEALAAHGLFEQGYDVYLPKIRVKRRRPGDAMFVEEPLFPRYLFVALITGEQSISPVQYTRGVQKLVRYGHEVLPIRGKMIRELKQLEDAKTGYHRLELPCLQPGDRVHITTGAFAGMDGVFEARSGEDRVVVLLEILGQQAQATVPIQELKY